MLCALRGSGGNESVWDSSAKIDMTITAPSFILVQKHNPQLNPRRMTCLLAEEQNVKRYCEVDDKGNYTEVVLEDDLWL